MKIAKIGLILDLEATLFLVVFFQKPQDKLLMMDRK